MLQLNQVARKPVSFLAPLINAESPGQAKEFAARLCQEAKEVGLNLRDYLTYKIDVRASMRDIAANDNRSRAVTADMNGYEASLAYLNLPVRNDIEAGVMLQAASSTFQTFPGTRILFPQVVDDVAKWAYRQTSFERVDALVGSKRTINGNELHSMVVNDDGTEYRKARAITEGGRIPVYKIQSTEQSVKIWKFGFGYETTYEFERRASVDLLTPYVARAEREVEMSKVAEATRVLINGDGAYGAAGEIDQSSYDGVPTGTATDGTLSYKHLLAWMVARAKAGLPIDTIVGNYDAYLQWLFLFALPTTDNAGPTATETMGKAGFNVRGIPILQGTVDFVLSSAAPANKLIGYSKADTLEELVENGSQISESEKSITNQKVTYVKTENSGFRLVFGDTRSVFDFGN